MKKDSSYRRSQLPYNCFFFAFVQLLVQTLFTSLHYSECNSFYKNLLKINLTDCLALVFPKFYRFCDTVVIVNSLGQDMSDVTLRESQPSRFPLDSSLYAKLS